MYEHAMCNLALAKGTNSQLDMLVLRVHTWSQNQGLVFVSNDMKL